MAEETQLPESQSDSSDLLRKIAAIIVGIIVIILIVFAAKWIGDRVRERFFPGTVTPTPTPVATQLPNGSITPVVTQLPDGTITTVPGGTPTKVPTYSNIPSTGPEDFAYVLVALMALGGLSTLALAKKKI